MGNGVGEEQEENKTLKTGIQLMLHLHGYTLIFPSVSLININKINMVLCPLTSVKEVKTTNKI